jgi:hypothetical protein
VPEGAALTIQRSHVAQIAELDLASGTWQAPLERVGRLAVSTCVGIVGTALGASIGTMIYPGTGTAVLGMLGSLVPSLLV